MAKKILTKMKELNIREVEPAKLWELTAFDGEYSYLLYTDAYYILKLGFLELCSIENSYYVMKELETGKIFNVTTELREKMVRYGYTCSYGRGSSQSFLDAYSM